ncbi:MAG: M23 family metallopeptidase [Alphaproteobacteria bacterium]|nr:M23 family metallopeptidase [Alphaproteobacteria bacterium]
MKKAPYIIISISLLLSYVNFYSKVYAQSHEKQETPQFIFPAACHYGLDCWAVNYVDVDPNEDKASDFKCGSKTYNEHKGTDFALGSVSQMREGVDVLAAAPGKIKRVRDGQSDSLKSEEELESIRQDKKECGNGVLIDHGNELQTMYCHLKKGSVIVKPHQKVKAGQKIAQIGQSGVTEFPHLHFSVLWKGVVVDPYTGALNTEGCGQKKKSMWHIGLPMKYEPVAIFNSGFRNKAPDFKAIERGDDVNPDILPLNSAAFIFWVGFYNVEKGDEVSLEIYDPDGQIFGSRKQIVEKTRARQYYFTGRKIGRVQLKKGTYKGIVKFSRSGKGQAVSKIKEFRVMVE